MLVRRQCAFRGANGEPCGAPPLKDGQFCWWHSPEHAQEVQEARKLGGLRRKREGTLSGAYEYEGIDSVQGIRRVLEIAILDTLAMENSISRNRTLAYLMMVALRTLEVGDLEERIAALEQSVHPNNIRQEPPAFDVETELLETGDKEVT